MKSMTVKDYLKQSPQEKLNDTMRFVNKITAKNSKAVILKNKNKKSNYNRKTNTIYVNSRDVAWLDKLAGLVIGSEEVAKRRKKFWWG